MSSGVAVPEDAQVRSDVSTSITDAIQWIDAHASLRAELRRRRHGQAQAEHLSPIAYRAPRRLCGV